MLVDLQRDFANALFADEADLADAAVLARLAGAADVAARFDIHRTNVTASLVTTLKAAYPAVHRIAGEARFNHAARDYVRRRPPLAPQLSAYGARFGAFLAGLPQTAAVPFIADLARLEWARNQAYFAADAAPLAPPALAAVDPADVPRLCLALHPSVALIASHHPIESIRRAFATEAEDIAPVDLEAPGERVLVLRPDLTVEGAILSPGDFTLLLALRAGAPLGGAVQAALTVEPAFDLQQALAAHLTRGAFCGFTLATD